MEKKYQVFISSTYTDLIEERQKAVEAILTAGHIPAGMELFHAGDETQKESISEWIEDSDIYVLILGGRYGSLDSNGMGYTHWEYEKAKELGKPIFSLVLTEDYLNKKVEDKKLKATDLSYNDDKLVTFRDEVMSKIVSNIDNIVQIEAEVIKSINRIIKKRENDLDGWIKGSSLKELEALRQENQKLSSKLVTSQSKVIALQKKGKPVKDEYIGQFKFSAVKQLLSTDLPDLDRLEELKKDVEQKLKVSKNSDSIEEYEGELKFIETIIKLNYSGLDMLMHVNSQLATSGFSPNNTGGQRYFRDFYFSKWIELSLVELKKGQKVYMQTYILSSAGKKFVAMIKMEKLN